MKETKLTRVFDYIARWFVGLVFIFSGFVKGVDPLGTSFKVQEYMTAWSLGSFTFEWALPFATLMAVVLIIFEFTVGIMLITKTYRKLTAWILLLMMVFFTCTTLVDAITNKVTDCGCFGDAIKLTNWQTFWKNIVLMVPTVFIFLCRNWSKRFERDTLIAIAAVASMLIFELYNINNEPCIDFRAWKVGNQMIPFDEGLEVQSFVTYKEKATGKTEEFPSKELMDKMQDPNWKDNWEFVDSRVVDPFEIKADGFSMLGLDGEDNAREIVGSPDPVIIATIHHLEKVDKEGIASMQRVHTFCVENNINLVLLTSALEEEVYAFLEANQLDDMFFYFADATAIETMLRSNPGYILLKDAKVLGKWHYKNTRKLLDFPFEEN